MISSLIHGAGDEPPTYSAWFGHAVDGDVTLPGGTTTLTDDAYYGTLIVPNGAILQTAGFSVLAATLIWVQSGGLILNSGGDCAAGLVAGAGAAAGNLGGGSNGGVGVANGFNNASASSGNPHRAPAGNGGKGGAGGTDAASSAGGAGGTQSTTLGLAFAMPNLAYGLIGSTKIPGGSGGGSGKGITGTGNGGGGGGGGGVILLRAPQVQIDAGGVVRAKGGKGADGTGVGGGGGGGGGGKLILATLAGGVGGIANADLAGGDAGQPEALVGTGHAGTPGNPGYVIYAYIN
jgi:hypothetical protein